MNRPIKPALAVALVCGWLVCGWLAAPLPAQGIVFLDDGGGAGPDETDDGVTVEMFESPNLDRFLRRAREFLDEEKYLEAIQVLQAVIEGRTLEATLPGEVASTEPGAAPAGADAGAGADERARLADPSQTVFSHDGRIYRPARRLCHEYLSRMPGVGLDLYRTRYEARAEDLLESALEQGDVSALEMVGNNFFATLAAGRAMQVLADRHMHEGRYRAAVQVLRDLSEVYPESNRQKLGISRLWCRFKIALCMRLAGEAGAALEAAQELAREYPDESLRVMGDLHPVADLPGSSLFTADDESVVTEVGVARREGRTWLGAETEHLVPLWLYRFKGDDPYRTDPAPGNNQRIIQLTPGTPRVNTAPYASKYGTGTRVAFLGDGEPAPRAVFLEHCRLRVADAFSGLLRLEGDGEDEPRSAHAGRINPRVPVYDLALMRPVEDGERIYVVLGYPRPAQSADPLLQNEIVAYDRDSGRRVWTTEQFTEGDDGYADVTFLAAPVVFGERLLSPVLRRDAYMLQCTDRASGRPLWRTRIHANGSRFIKAPGTPVLVSGSLAYVLTNAGCLAAVDAFAGDLKWIRRYERSDPLRPVAPVVRSRGRQTIMRGNQMQFQEGALPFFQPSEMFAVGGTIVFAGCDSRMLMCIDGATGEPLWMIDGTTGFAPYGNLEYLVGTNSQHLYAASRSDLVCIELRSGLIRWAMPLPQASDSLTSWRGRGCVLEDHVLMPGDREVLVLDADGGGQWRRLQLPSFGIGDEPLRGPNNLFSSGPWLGVSYAQGIEVYSTGAALLELGERSDDVLFRATCAVQAGQREQGLAILEEWLAGEVADPAVRVRGEQQLVALAREIALAQGRGGLGVLDRAGPLVADRVTRMRWFLARLDFFQRTGDLRAYATEQQRLYRFMEGKD